MKKKRIAASFMGGVLAFGLLVSSGLQMLAGGWNKEVKPDICFTFENETDVKFLSREQQMRVYREWKGQEPEETQFAEWAEVHVLASDARVAIDYENSLVRESDVIGVFFQLAQWYSDADGSICARKAIREDAVDELLGQFTYVDQLYLEAEADGDSYIGTENGTCVQPRSIYEGYVTAASRFDGKEDVWEQPVSEWNEVVSLSAGGLGENVIPVKESACLDRSFLGIAEAKYYDEDADCVCSSLTYFVTEAALADPENPFAFAEKLPEEDDPNAGAADKASIDFVFEKESCVKYLDPEQRVQVYREWFGKEPDQDVTLADWAEVHVINEDTLFSIDYANSAVSKENVRKVIPRVLQWYKDEDGKIRARKWAQYIDEWDEDGSLHTYPSEEECVYENYIYFEAHKQRDEDVWYYDENGACEEPRNIYDGYMTNPLWLDPDQIMSRNPWEDPVSEWSEPSEMTLHEDAYYMVAPIKENHWLDRGFLGILSVGYYNEETDSEWTIWEYFVTEEALADPENPFVFLDEIPEEEKPDHPSEDDPNAGVTDEETIDFVFEKESCVKYLDMDQHLQVYREWFGLEPDQGTTQAERPEVHVINKDTLFSIDYANSAVSKENVRSTDLRILQWYKDADGKIRARRAYSSLPYGGALHPYEEYIFFEKGQGNGTCEEPRSIYDGYVTNMPLSAWGKNPWTESVSEWYTDVEASSDEDTYQKGYPIKENNWLDRCFLGICSVDYYDEEADSVWTTWTYFVTEEALADPENPFVFLDQIPEEKPDDPPEDDPNAGVTDKESLDFVFEKESGIKYLDREQDLQVYREWRKKEPSESTTLGEWAEVHVINKDTLFSIDYANSAVSKENVRGVKPIIMQWYKDADGKIRARKSVLYAYDYDEEFHLYKYPLREYVHADYIYFEAHQGGNGWYCDQNDACEVPRNIYDGYVTNIQHSTSGVFGYNPWEEPVSKWNEPVEASQDVNAYELVYPIKENHWLDRCFLGILQVSYYNEETDSEWITWEYFVTEEALADPDNPFVFLDEKPEEEKPDNPPEDDPAEKPYEVTLVSGKEIISREDFAAILEQNAVSDVVIRNAQGMTFTFAKGTMKAVDGLESYDFSATVSTDYDANKSFPGTSRDNFVQRIDFGYSGVLPAMASICIPVGKAYAGKTLYYTRYDSEKGYNLIQSVLVDADGMITVRQDRCSTYLITTEALKEDDGTDTPGAGGGTDVPGAGGGTGDTPITGGGTDVPGAGGGTSAPGTGGGTDTPGAGGGTDVPGTGGGTDTPGAGDGTSAPGAGDRPGTGDASSMIYLFGTLAGAFLLVSALTVQKRRKREV